MACAWPLGAGQRSIWLSCARPGGGLGGSACAGRRRVAMLVLASSRGHAYLRGIVLCGLVDWGLGLGWGCEIDVEWMSDVRAVLAACVVRPAHRSFAQSDIS